MDAVRISTTEDGALLLLQPDGRLLRWDPAHPTLFSNAPDMPHDARWLVSVAGGGLFAGTNASLWVGEPQAIRIDSVDPSAATAVGDLLLVANAGVLTAVWSRGCECAPNYRMLSGACVPCPNGKHSALGARACGVCAQGEFFDGEACMPCPSTLWWNGAEECTRLRSTASSERRITLAQALRVRTPMPYAIVCVDGTPDNMALDALDALGAFWQISYAPPAAAFDMVARIAAPAIVCGTQSQPARFDCVSPIYYWDARLSACTLCPNATWALSDDATQCALDSDMPSTCPAGAFLALALRACRPCPPDTFSPRAGRFLACLNKTVHRCPNDTYIYDDGRALSDNVCQPCETACLARVPFEGVCDGRTTAQPYLCLQYETLAGVRLRALDYGRVEASLCPLPPPNAEWTHGPLYEVCYYRCLWTVNPIAWTDPSIVCPPPPACPEGAYRNTPTTCALMDTLPANALIQASGGWACAPGWFFRLDACVQCDATFCNGGERFDPSYCGGLLSGCAPCPDTYGRGITLRLDVAGRCAYLCDPPMMPSNRSDAPCTICADTPPFNSQCPPGYAWRNCSCVACAPGITPFGAVLAPSPDSICRIWCRPGFLTLAYDTLLLVANADQPQDPARVVCQPCSKQPRLPCAQCPSGTLAPHCTPCVAPYCAPPTFAPATCPGGAAGSMPCLLCPPLGALREWVAPPCVSACVRDTHDVQGRCEPCSTLPIPKGAPYIVYRSIWNATPGMRWWPSVFDPPHMPPRTLTTRTAEERAGVCWPCDTTTRTPYGGDPCGTLVNPPDAPTIVLHIPLSARRLLVSAQPPEYPPRTMRAYTLDRRRLEWTLPPPRPIPTLRPRPPPVCAPGWVVYDARHVRPQCVPCPPWASPGVNGVCVPTPQKRTHRRVGCPMALAHPQPFDRHLCGCIPGTELNANGSACERCPRGTASRSLGNAPCVSTAPPFPALSPLDGH